MGQDRRGARYDTIPDKGMTLINVELEERAPRINIPPIGKTLVHLGG